MNYSVLLVKTISDLQPVYVTKNCFILEGLIQIPLRTKSSQNKTEQISICFWSFLESSIKNCYKKDEYFLVEGSLSLQDLYSEKSVVFTAVKIYSYKL